MNVLDAGGGNRAIKKNVAYMREMSQQNSPATSHQLNDSGAIRASPLRYPETRMATENMKLASLTVAF
jgi:hypothetical protein